MVAVVKIHLPITMKSWPLVKPTRMRSTPLLQSNIADADARLVQRQALAGMLWSKQFYRFDIRRWLEGDPLQPAPPPERQQVRNAEWLHLNNRDIISMPDTWEYPWYAAWDLAFQAVTFALIDPAVRQAAVAAPDA